jgi:deoxyribose-phosphate aldolase
MKGLEYGAQEAGLVDLILCQGDLTASALEEACREARGLGLFGVCVCSSRVVEAAHWLDDSPLKVTCAIGFPQGTSDADTKRFETEAAVDSGAHFIELSANAGHWKEGNETALVREWRDVVEAADERPVSVRFEAAILAMTDVARLALLAQEGSLDGLTLAAPSEELVKAIRASLGKKLTIKVELDSRSQDFVALGQAGATRFGVRR